MDIPLPVKCRAGNKGGRDRSNYDTERLVRKR